jgi:Ca-activated chloride channel family protein
MIAMEFLNPGRLWWLVAVAALAVGYVAVQQWRRRTTLRFTAIDLLDRVAPHRPGWRRHVVAGLQLLGLAAGVVAIARPIERETVRTQSEGRILVLFDVSLSMMATDVDPSRLEAAKEAARDFVDQVDPNVEVGLISFSGVVTTEVEPSLDREAMDRGIDNLGDSGGNEEVAPGAIVLLSDGETTVGRPTAEGGRAAADAGVPVFTIAFGTPEGTITDPVSGETVPVAVQPGPLQDVADETGGTAYEAATGSELADAYSKIQDSLGQTLGEEVEKITELTWQWAAIALAILAAAWALGLWWLRGMV